MERRIVRAMIVSIVAAAAVACATASARFYTLDSTATPDGTAAGPYAIAVGPVSLPPAVDRPQFVVQVAPNRVSVDEFNRWAAPLDDGVARAVAGDLGILLGTSEVAVAPVTGFVPAYRVTIDVQRFESTPGQGVVVEALWAVRPSSGGALSSGRTVARETAEGKGFDAIAAAHSRALAKVSTDIAAAIRAQASKRSSPRRERKSP
jgi:hypothetical protein